MSETEITWQKSSHSSDGDGNNCVELAAQADSVVLRESDEPQAVLTTAATPLGALLRGVKAGQFDGAPTA